MTENKLCFNDILLLPRYSELDSRTTPDVSTTIGNLDFDIPIISSPMDSVTGINMLVAMSRSGGLGILSRHISMDDDEELKQQEKDIITAHNIPGLHHTGCAIGIKGDVQRKVNTLIDAGCQVVCIDIAHGDHSKMYKILELITKIQSKNDFVIMAGNVCTVEAAKRFEDAGVNAIKIGIGPGAACTTRIVTGFGMPQLSAIHEIYEALGGRRKRVSLIADGGIRTSGDMVKALWAGADACMIGYLLAGTDCAPTINGIKMYRGMSSRDVSEREDIAPEGVVMNIQDKGPTVEVLHEYTSGIKGGLSMGGAADLGELREHVKHVVVSPLSLEETLPRDG